MIGVDTNVIVRLFADDDPAQTLRAKRAIDSAQARGEPVLVNDIVLVETLCTMRSRYRARSADIAALAASLFDASAFTFENRAAVERALALFVASTADYADCLIVAKNKSLGARSTLSFDRAFKGLPDAQLL